MVALWVRAVCAAWTVVLLPALFMTAAGSGEEEEPAASAAVAGGRPEGMDPVVFDALTKAVSAAGCPGLRWQLLAGVWEKETQLGTHGGASVLPNGDVRPKIFGEETPYGRAEGAGQFIPSSWELFGGDGNGDGVADPHNVYDAAVGTARHLCSSGEENLAVAGAERRAVWRYYGADIDGYADDVLARAARYDQLTPTTPPATPGGETAPTSAVRAVAGGGRLAEPAASRWEAAVLAAGLEGVELRARSSYRDPAEQAALRWRYGCPDLTSPSWTCRDRPVAPVGQSMHQQGLAVDVENLAGAWAWMAANAPNYGLHARIPTEPWHYSTTGH
jgi:hypothetical protein